MKNSTPTTTPPEPPLKKGGEGGIFIIAEAGVNHNGDVVLARKLIDAAVAAGADAVKFQSFRADSLVTQQALKAEYQTRNLGDSQLSQYEMLKALELKPEDFIFLKEYCDKKGILFMATPFDHESVDFLEGLVDRYKVSSGDCTNLPLLRQIASKKKQVILSTGMADLKEVRLAVETLKDCAPTLLHCTTNYPCPMEEVNLKAMFTLKKEFGLPVGYSDHTNGIEIAIAAAALGAIVIEKHFTLDRAMKGPDHRASLEPDDLGRMVASIRNLEKAMGDGIKAPRESELAIRNQARRSLVASRDLSSGTVLKKEDLDIKRPGTGIPPEKIDLVIGRRTKRDLTKDELLSLEALED